MEKFDLVSKYTPTGDQPEAIRKLVEGLKQIKNTSFTRCYWNW
jgi:Helicase subunit of the DNA excision repair complex